MTPAPAGEPPRGHVCPLCSTQFMSGAVRCGACPMSRACDLECCPNCGYAVPVNGSGEDTRANPSVHYGDRILVLKYRYLITTQDALNSIQEVFGK